ncbi:IclR family transcriptional regulator [Microbacterium trichothecenolyticum]|uniref:HTH-type transcriptional regulator KipR n=1 Tax=Microbacterium trichothecenolyticum TaxID=69370 RepID=A0A0M2HD99_MICTR|nr:IclR family transcriptional regulator [Microbacterium trichothecenolyticum]KJL42152.1 HTH-type transcriptional regulator KipR [Microbacterium trichothecenolyticum]
MARGSDGESVLHKHLRVLQAFDVLRPLLTLTEIVDATGLAVSTTHRLVAELEREGLLERMPDRSYRLGLRLWEFASRTPGALGLRELARPWLEAVHSRVRQHTQLGVLSGRDVLFIERLSTRDAVVNATVIGGRVPLPVSSSGLVLLAHSSPGVVEDVIAAGWPAYTPATIRDAEALRARLRRVRADGFAVTEGHIHRESRGIAVPVMDHHGVVHAALGVVVASDGTPPQPAIELLTVAAAGIARALTEAGGAPGGHGMRTMASTSRRSLDYFSSLDAHTMPSASVG